MKKGDNNKDVHFDNDYILFRFIFKTLKQIILNFFDEMWMLICPRIILIFSLNTRS